MTTSTQALAFAAIVTAVAAAIGTGLAERGAAPSSAVVQLERVVIVGKRADAQQPLVVTQLPRVVIEGRRSALPDDLQLADAKPLNKAI